MAEHKKHTYTVSVTLPHNPYTQDQLETMAQMLGILLTPAFIEEMQETAKTYLTDKEGRNITLRPAQERKTYETFSHLFKDLNAAFQTWSVERRLQFVERFEQPYWDARKSLDDDSLHHFDATTPPPGGNVFDMLSQAEDLASRLYLIFMSTLHQLPADKGGPIEEWPLHAYIRRLAAIYERETGKKAGRSYNHYRRQGSGPFVRFVTACLHPIAPENCTPSLYKSIERALAS